MPGKVLSMSERATPPAPASGLSTRDYVERALREALAAMPPGWSVLQDAELPGRDGEPPTRIGYVLVHPRIGIAVLDLLPGPTSDTAVARLHRMMEESGWRAEFGGLPPLIHLCVPLRALPGLEASLHGAFAARPPAALRDGGWVTALRGLLGARLLLPAGGIAMGAGGPASVQPTRTEPLRPRFSGLRALAWFWSGVALAFGVSIAVLAYLGPAEGPGSAAGPVQSASAAPPLPALPPLLLPVLPPVAPPLPQPDAGPVADHLAVAAVHDLEPAPPPGLPAPEQSRPLAEAGVQPAPIRSDRPERVAMAEVSGRDAVPGTPVSSEPPPVRLPEPGAGPAHSSGILVEIAHPDISDPDPKPAVPPLSRAPADEPDAAAVTRAWHAEEGDARTGAAPLAAPAIGRLAEEVSAAVPLPRPDTMASAGPTLPVIPSPVVHPPASQARPALLPSAASDPARLPDPSWGMAALLPMPESHPEDPAPPLAPLPPPPGTSEPGEVQAAPSPEPESPAPPSSGRASQEPAVVHSPDAAGTTQADTTPPTVQRRPAEASLPAAVPDRPSTATPLDLADEMPADPREPSPALSGRPPGEAGLDAVHLPAMARAEAPPAAGGAPLATTTDQPLATDQPSADPPRGPAKASAPTSGALPMGGSAQAQTAMAFPGASASLPSPAARSAAAGAAAQPQTGPMIRRADAMLAHGDISAARLLYARAAAVGSGEAMLALGKVHDPLFLAEIGARGLVGDAGVAINWYRRALALGVADAREWLLRHGVHPDE